MKNCKERVLIFRVGSLGDTIVALPAFNLIRKEFCNAEIKVLSNLPTGSGSKEALLQSVMGKSSLVDGYYNYSLGRGRLRGLLDIAKELRAWGVTHVIYMMPVRTRLMIARDWLFFKYIVRSPQIVGISFSRNKQVHLYSKLTGLYEPEYHRILRNLSELGSIELSQSSFGLEICRKDIQSLTEKIKPEFSRMSYIVCCIGTKWDSKDWGLRRWSELMKKISGKYPGLGLIMIGSKDEFLDSDRVRENWSGRSQNLCGELTVHESAETLKKACCYFGHDSGPMHLSYSVQTPCVAVFSAQGKPGVWFPFGEGHEVLYHKTECFGCELEYCNRHDKKCLTSISVNEVFNVAKKLLERTCVE